MGKVKWKEFILTPSSPQRTRTLEVNNLVRKCFVLFAYST